MELTFRQGLVRFQTDLSSNPTFLQFSPSGVTLNVSPDPTIITFAHGLDNYTFEERVTVPNAWAGPFDPVDQWLFWDLDLITAERTFGITKLDPIVSNNQPASTLDQHWFDLTSTTMKVFTGSRFVEKIRVFAAKLDDGATLIPFGVGSQVGINQNIKSGTILFDDGDRAIKKFNRFDRGKFIHTETPLSSQFLRLVNLRLENSIQDAIAFEDIPAFFAISYGTAQNTIGLARNTQPNQPAVGISSEEIFTGEVRSFVSSGYLNNELWNWTNPPGTPIFVGETGELTTTVPQSFSLQQVAQVVSKKTILVDIKPIILY